MCRSQKKLNLIRHLEFGSELMSSPQANKAGEILSCLFTKSSYDSGAVSQSLNSTLFMRYSAAVLVVEREDSAFEDGFFFECLDDGRAPTI